ncbi:MAG: inorganic phosphate transporter [Actinobacteria bacterium]|nr:inorganic phosphate transporter [Actinomycetota bacterium]
MDLPLVAVVGLALLFSYTNGFHDSANAIATSVSTRSLTPRIALALAACANLLGAFFGMRVAETIGAGIVDAGGATLGLCAAALVGAIGWNFFTWWRGLPSSSSHALIGGLVGAALVGGVRVRWDAVLERVVLPMIVSPLVGLALGWALMILIGWVFRRHDRSHVSRGFRSAQTVSATAMAFGHGMQDAAKVAGVVVLALIAGGRHSPHEGDFGPWWVVLLSGIVMSAGTYAGGWRIMRTLGGRIIALTPPQGFAAETSAAVTLALATAFRAPISTTYAITAAIMGVGSSRNVRDVRWDVGRDILVAWVATLPGAALAAAAVHGILRLLG